MSEVCLVVGCLTSQQHASVSQGRVCSDKFMCCHTEIEVASQTFYLTQSLCTDTGPASPSVDPVTPGTWQGRHWSASQSQRWPYNARHLAGSPLECQPVPALTLWRQAPGRVAIGVPASPSIDPMTPGTWQGRHWSASQSQHWPYNARHLAGSPLECQPVPALTL